MDLRQLRYFAQIVESGSLSKASRLLYVAQPALSQQLAKLEGEVGKALLVRSPTGVAPTEHGLALYHHARFVLRQMDQAMSIARQGSGAVQGMVSVGLPATTVGALGLPLVRRVRERYPSIMLNVVEGMSGHLAQMMRVGKLDLADPLQQRRCPGRLHRAAARGRAVRHPAGARHLVSPRADAHDHRGSGLASPYRPHRRARAPTTDRRRIRAPQPLDAHRCRDRLALAGHELRLCGDRRDDQADGRGLPRRRARAALARACRSPMRG